MKPDSSTRPLRVMFVITSMPVGGAETLLVNLVRRFDRSQIEPMICCLKEKGPLGEDVSSDVPVFEQLIGHKFDVAVAGRLKKLMQTQKVDAVVTVGAGDKMFWGRLAARRARVPVVLSALHSTGWPDGVGRLNRMLTRITDGFIAVADSHGKFMVEFERFPPEKVFVIPNGIDTDRFVFNGQARETWRQKCGIPTGSPVVGIVAALRSEKNHPLFINAAARTLAQIEDAHFVIAGDGPERPALEALVAESNLTERVHFLGSVSDIPSVLSMIDLFALTSHNEASPVSILEAMSCERPVVATDVGSIRESVIEGQTGLLVPEGDLDAMSDGWIQLLDDLELGQSYGRTGRSLVQQKASVSSMTDGYTRLIWQVYSDKVANRPEDSLFFAGASHANREVVETSESTFS